MLRLADRGLAPLGATEIAAWGDGCRERFGSSVWNIARGLLSVNRMRRAADFLVVALTLALRARVGDAAAAVPGSAELVEQWRVECTARLDRARRDLSSRDKFFAQARAEDERKRVCNDVLSQSSAVGSL
jgi:hypothetical protein